LDRVGEANYVSLSLHPTIIRTHLKHQGGGPGKGHDHNVRLLGQSRSILLEYVSVLHGELNILI